MAGWYKMDETDAFNLAEIQYSFVDRRSRYKRLRMLNFIWSRINSKGKPCPYFCLGQRTIAEKCDVSVGTVRRFIESLESDGRVVRVGDGYAGETPKRTFWWIAESAANDAGVPTDIWLKKVCKKDGSLTRGSGSNTKSIETKWHGCRFRSRLEARWAVLFEVMGIEWDYEPVGFALSNGVCYLPDFLLHDIAGCGYSDIYVEVKGRMTGADYEKIQMFSHDKPIYLVGNHWNHSSQEEWYEPMERACCEWPYFYNSMTVDGACSGVFLGVNDKGKPQLFSSSFANLSTLTSLAYNVASLAEFDGDDQPEDHESFRRVRDHIRSLRDASA